MKESKYQRFTSWLQILSQGSKAGNIKRFFATGITPNGTVSYVKSLLQTMKKIYLINVPEGYSNTSFMNILLDGAVYRGFDVEAYYCPMDQREKSSTC